ncbi:MAG: AfsR/SARP family transcriptional regulator, partial [Nonomuraea sp.]|nr:AfsR/SARP family transcriptional regulator [Nonomuraea sp.]
MSGGARLRVVLLGGFRVTGGDDVLPVAGARLRGLLVRLALAGGRAVEPGVLVEAIWGEEPPSGPGPALQTLVSRLRRALAPHGEIEQVVGGYRLAAEVDALRFERLAARGRERLRAGDPGEACSVLGEAVGLWGDLPGVEPAVVASVAPAVATRLAHVSVEAVADLAESELSLGRAGAAAARLTDLLAGQPVHERAAALLMDALAAQGRQAEALAVYERFRRTLADTLGADPGTALRARHLGLLRPTPPTPEPAVARSILATNAAPRRGPLGNLPAPLTSFVGRDGDLDRVDALLATGRLVTVTGPGGAGKTRLAIEAARKRRHRDGTWLIDLASVTEPAKLGAAVLAGTGLRGSSMLDRRAADDDLDALVGRDTLLLLDNCEHLIDAVAHLVATLLPRCPDLRVLATSREPLAIDGETLVPLSPLDLPDPDDDVERASETAAVRLFAERAAAVSPGFAVDPATLPDVVRVVRALDGMPLALELAAARLRTLTLPALAGGLSDRFALLNAGTRTAPPRHRTLAAVIAWSWDLLSDHERTLAERISVLPGGVTPASAAAVCAGTAVLPAEVPGLLAALVDRSLLQLAPGRYRMLETIREYGQARLTTPSARDLAASHFTELLARQDAELRGPGQLAAMRAITTEYDNTLAALRHLCDSGDSRGATALALNLTWYWQMFGRHTDAAHWLERTLAIPGEPSPGRDCLRAAHLLNRADLPPGDPAGTRDLAERVLAHRDLPDHHRVFGAVLLFLRQDRSARPTFERLAETGDAWLSGLAHFFLAELAENAGAPGRTRTHVDAALTRFREAGDHWGTAATLPMRARLRRYDDLDGALDDLREAGTLAAEFGSPSLADQLHGDLRWIDLHVRRGETGQALALIDAARRRSLPAELLALVDAQEADLRVRLGDLDRAATLLDRTPVSTARAALCLARGDLPGAEQALAKAHAAALATGELPILSQVTVTTAAL